MQRRIDWLIDWLESNYIYIYRKILKINIEKKEKKMEALNWKKIIWLRKLKEEMKRNWNLVGYNLYIYIYILWLHIINWWNWLECFLVGATWNHVSSSFDSALSSHTISHLFQIFHQYIYIYFFIIISFFKK